MREKTAPIQNARTIAESPWLNPRRNPRTKMYLTSPRPNHVPLEIKKIKRNGIDKITPEATNWSRETKNESLIANKKLYRKDKTNKETKKESFYPGQIEGVLGKGDEKKCHYVASFYKREPLAIPSNNDRKMKIERDHKNKEGVIDSAQPQSNEGIVRCGEDCFICI